MIAYIAHALPYLISLLVLLALVQIELKRLEKKIPKLEGQFVSYENYNRLVSTIASQSRRIFDLETLISKQSIQRKRTIIVSKARKGNGAVRARH